MKIYIFILEDNPHLSPNPFIYTLMDSVETQHDDVTFGFRKEIFWTDEIFAYDIVHIMWPDALVLDGEHTILELQEQLQHIRNHKVKIVCTCHNLHSNNMHIPEAVAAYDLVYGYADEFIHLWEYSKQILECKYPQAKHVIIPHHVYDTVYTRRYSKKEALEKLNLKDRKYAISFGKFRYRAEKMLFLRAADIFRKYGIWCIAPGFMDIPQGRINMRWIKQHLKWLILKLRHPNIIVGGGYISDGELPYYYAISSISFLQREDILNSGNLPLGIYYGNVVIGPNVGNVGRILHDLNYPIFEVNNGASLQNAINQSLLISPKTIKEISENYKEKWSTQKCAESHYLFYKQVK